MDQYMDGWINASSIFKKPPLESGILPTQKMYMHFSIPPAF